jgi:hypothetical protein
VAVEAASTVAGLVAAPSTAAGLVAALSTAAALAEAVVQSLSEAAVSARPLSEAEVSAQPLLGAVDFAAEPSQPMVSTTAVSAAAVSTTDFTTMGADLRSVHLHLD